MSHSIKIGRGTIGLLCPCFIIAEAGVNHNGSLEMAHRLIDVAVLAGADAVKFQSFQADRLVTPDAPKAIYQQHTTDSHESQYEMLRSLELSPEALRELIAHCHDKGIVFMSTPFDEVSADLLDEMGVVVFKTPSGEITNLPYLANVARKGKPMIVSTGMATLGEVEAAVQTIEAMGCHEFVLMHCVSSYPAAPTDVNLRAMHTMAVAFGVPVGFSDHTLGIEIPIAAVALGACAIEKHFTIERGLPGPDHQASLEPEELAAMVSGIRKVEAALGDGRKKPAASEANTATVARRSLVTAFALPAGTELVESMIAIKRPGTGLPPTLLPYVLGRTLQVDVPAGALLTLDVLK